MVDGGQFKADGWLVGQPDERSACVLGPPGIFFGPVFSVPGIYWVLFRLLNATADADNDIAGLSLCLSVSPSVCLSLYLLR